MHQRSMNPPLLKRVLFGQSLEHVLPMAVSELIISARNGSRSCPRKPLCRVFWIALFAKTHRLHEADEDIRILVGAAEKFGACTHSVHGQRQTGV